MKAAGAIGFVLLFASGSVTPAAANWFSNPYLGISQNIGSAPNPTPEQIRQGLLGEQELFLYEVGTKTPNSNSSATALTGWYYQTYEPLSTDLTWQAYRQPGKPGMADGPSWFF
jgi:hypothetical protein